ncbi:uncharacterized protein LOC126375914 isoform X2 [Pectinophora gossypiella]|uniref:uncharacterized protein LOC126375914 isoform X2 n=1 Tax=Pectinophora gossypiella TaxID=13191 RepID=UPI00214E6B7E|nr:uncharacterized protein LOC126375914 isoform X2 [Pectinophora gossypiella]
MLNGVSQCECSHRQETLSLWFPTPEVAIRGSDTYYNKQQSLYNQLSSHASGIKYSFGKKLFSYRHSHKDDGTSPVLMRVSSQWERYAFDAMSDWEQFHMSWLNFRGKLHIVKYETLVSDTRRVLKDILEFIKFNVSEEDLDCVMKHREGIWLPNHPQISFDPFTEVMYSRLDDIQITVSDAIAEKNLTIDNELTTLPRKEETTTETTLPYKEIISTIPGVNTFKKLVVNNSISSSNSDSLSIEYRDIL